MFLFFPLVTLLLALVAALWFRNVQDTAVLLSIALGTVVMTEGLLIGTGTPLNMITIMLPTILIALSVADAVHLIHAFHEARAKGADADDAAGLAARAVALPCAGTTLSTIAGFLAFSGSAVVPVFQLAVYASFGIALAWVLTMTVGPALLAVLWRHRARVEPRTAATATRRLIVVALHRPQARVGARHLRDARLVVVRASLAGGRYGLRQVLS